jgi:hypothetical protein
MNSRLNPWKLSGYKAGQNIVCKVVQQEPGGYAVHIPKDNLPGFLPTEAKLKIGEEVLAQFVCVANNRVLLSARIAGGQLSASGKYRAPQVSWEDQLKNPDAPVQQPAPSPPAGAPPPAYTPAAPVPMPGQQPGLPSNEQDAAFAVWAQNEPVNFKLRRAIDLILPSIGEDQGQKMRIGDEDLEWLITQLEGGMRTGCVKAFCEPRKSRSAVLLYRGRAVGCIYGNKNLPEPQPTEPSLQMMLNDLNEPDTNLLCYDLPENVTLAMSALFLGYPVERSDDLDAKSYIQYIGSWLEQKEQTACLAVSLPSTGATCLIFVHKGKFIGSFYVEDQKFSTEISFVYDLLAKDPQAQVSASILPPELTSTSVRFGFSLSMAKKAASTSVHTNQNYY